MSALVSNLVRLRAADFAATDESAQTAGLVPPSATAVLAKAQVIIHVEPHETSEPHA